MKKWAPVIVLFVLVVFGIWFWSLGRMPTVAAATASIEQIDGQVEYQESPQSDWVIAFARQTLKPGSTLRTQASSTVIISWFGRGQTRISENSTIKIDQATESEQGSLQLNLNLEAGRIWSRLIHTLDLDSSVQIRTSDVIATVRGTAFDMQKPTKSDPTTLWVSDSVVEAQNIHRNNQSTFVAQGSMVKMDAQTRSTSSEPISNAGLSSSWFQSNQAADRTFMNVFRTQLKQTPQAPVPALGGVGSWLQARSFDLHLAFAGKGKKALARQLLEQDLLTIRARFDQGLSGSAVQQFNELERELKGESKASPELEALTKSEQAAVIKHVLPAFDDRSPDSSMFRLKQRMEDVLLALSMSDNERLFHRLYGIAERLDEATESLDQNDMKQADVLTDIAEKGLENYARETKDNQDKSPEKQKIDAIQYALILRAAALRLAIANSRIPLQDTGPTSTIPVSSPTSTTTTTSSTETGVCQDFRFTVTPGTLTVGSSTVLNASITVDGQKQDVTANTQFTFPALLKQTDGKTAQAIKAGKGQVDALYTCNNEPMIAHQSIIVTEPVPATPVIVSLEVRAEPSKIQTLGRSQMTVLARFQDGQSQDVTLKSSLRLGNPNVGQLKGNVFEAYQISGQTDVIADYIDGSKTWSGSAGITITNPDIPPTADTSTQTPQ